ncbi:MAG: alkyl/aryl-sulfatase [Gammaproteobacteria bacterium]|nr:alkyl/aryl-sulfatase [Gammaproteobacteria bacterium]
MSTQRPSTTGFRTAAAVLALCAVATFQLPAQETTAEATLRARASEFAREVVRVTPDVYTAVGYSPANVSMIVGDDGVIIIDTAMSPAHAAEIVKAFREITALPVKGIIYTHGHGDHTGGTAAFVDGAMPEIWARDNLGAEDRPLLAAGLTIQQQRGVRQAGFALPDDLRINNGIAPPMRPGRADAFGTAVSRAADQARVETSPNHTFSRERQTITIAGRTLELVQSPGETDDQLYVWYPAAGVLFAGDNYYKSFPNLYAIRGTPYRDVLAWANSLDKMINEQPRAVVPGHTRPVLGPTAAVGALTRLRDAIAFVHDKTVEGMNKGLTPDALVQYVQLPPELARDPDLGEYYGRVDWAVRSIFTGYLGWYDGNPTQLSPLSPTEEARRLAALAGGQDKLLAQARQALAAGDTQWAAQLADHLLALNSDDQTVRLLKADALTVLARDSVNALARNYYLTVAAQLRQ